jgi:hypothetical protein
LLGVATANSIAAISSPGSVSRTDGPAACDCSCRPQPRKAVQDRALQNCTIQEKRTPLLGPKQGPTAWTTYKAPTPPHKPIVVVEPQVHVGREMEGTYTHTPNTAQDPSVHIAPKTIRQPLAMAES